ncbi:hypothetical protein OG21DRAFT_1524140 [Imleria badia]|nr:hypothetical protein OG21DRAFT_1524140 [Imleria badia]
MTDRQALPPYTPSPPLHHPPLSHAPPPYSPPTPSTAPLIPSSPLPSPWSHFTAKLSTLCSFRGLYHKLFGSQLEDPLVHLESISIPSFEMFQEAPPITIKTSIHEWGPLMIPPQYSEGSALRLRSMTHHKLWRTNHQHEFLIIVVENMNTGNILHLVVEQGLDELHGRSRARVGQAQYFLYILSEDDWKNAFKTPWMMMNYVMEQANPQWFLFSTSTTLGDMPARALMSSVASTIMEDGMCNKHAPIAPL